MPADNLKKRRPMRASCIYRRDGHGGASHRPERRQQRSFAQTREMATEELRILLKGTDARSASTEKQKGTPFFRGTPLL